MGLGERSMRIILAALLLVGCTSADYKPNKWHYMGPDHVDCTHDRELIEICRKMGPYMICECRYV